MVYRGKPSTGCLNCRSRHIKCDETRPHCRACVRTGRTCPGYPHPLDVMLRQRTAFQRKKRTVPTGQGESSPTNSNNSGVAIASPVSTQSDMSVSPTSPTSVSPKYPPLSEVRPAGVPNTLYFPMEDTVTSLFFNSYLYLPKDPLIRIGFMELLPQSYSNTKQGSHLHLSALAVSFFSVAAWTGNPSLLRSAEQFFAKAISKTRVALQGNIDGTLDEILMTVLLLSTYEEFAAIKDNRVPAKAHLHGAIALINSRGKQQEDTQYSGTLSSAVQTQIIKTSMGLSNSMIQTPNVWPLSPPIPQSLSSQLTAASSALVNLRQEYADAISKPGIYDIAGITNLLARASNLDVHISAWEHTLPQYWKPISASMIPQSVRDAGIYRNRCDCYPDQWIASTWNFYRESRVAIQKIILNCLRLLPNREDAPEQIQATVARIRSIAMDICATVPFFLGSQVDSVQLGPADIQYPEAEGRRVSQAHRQAAPLLGGWFVLFHLTNLCSPELCLPEEQIAWIGEQKWRVHRIYNLDIATGQALGR